MTARSTPPFRAEHVGSLLRPPTVKQARDDLVAGRIDAADLRAVEDAAIRELVTMQQEVGLRLVTDGEIRRTTWHMDFYYQIAGVLKMPEKVRIAFHNAGGNVEFSADAVTLGGKVRLEKTIFGEDFAFLRSIAGAATPKLTIPSPCVLHRTMLRQAGGGGIANAYGDPAEFLDDLATVYRDQIARLGALGCGYLQLDDTTFAGLCDPAGRQASSQAGADGEHLHLTYIRLMNEALKQRPAGMTVCTHTCRGNYRSAWYASGGYDFMAEALFSELAVDGFFLEYDDERSGGFEPLRFVPKGKVVVLGLVSSKLPALESKDLLKRRIDAAAKHLPLDQLCLSPQCGFSSTQEGNALTAEQQAAKLRLVVETAREVWG